MVFVNFYFLTCRFYFFVALVTVLLALDAFTDLDVPLIAALAAFDATPPPGIKLEAILMAAPAFWYHFVFLLVRVRMSSPTK